MCNKVGGIYTVLSSKAARMIEHYQDNYFVIGPYFPKKVIGNFEEAIPPEQFKKIFDELRQAGISCHFGKWLVKGNPNAILIDFTDFSKRANDIKKTLWDAFQIDSLGTGWFDFDEPVVWAWAVGMLIEKLSKVSGQKCVAHFHEWLAGAGLLYLKLNKVPVGTVFTTHATILGRTLSSEGCDLYNVLNQLKPDDEARKRGQGLWAKHQTEKQCAKFADAFTTVSEITGIEATKLLGKKPDVILPNGLDLEKFPTFEQASMRHALFKQRIKLFTMYYFFPYYNFDLDNSLFFFIAGRYEFRDKGIDVFLRALAKLNQSCRKPGKTIIAFIFVPADVKSIRPDLLENRMIFYDIKDTLDDEHDNIMNRLMYSLVSKKELNSQFLFSEDVFEDLKRKTLRMKKQGSPPLSTHEIVNEGDDVILNTIKSLGLLNREQDCVKVIYYPIYLTGADSLLDTNYYESMTGCHLGVFPSEYEPWGYTPLEAAALGVSSVTTDLSGFGRFVNSLNIKRKFPGVFVLKRFGKKEDEIVDSLYKFFNEYSLASVQERVENKITAKKIAEQADWKMFIEFYLKAHNLAVERVK